MVASPTLVPQAGEVPPEKKKKRKISPLMWLLGGGALAGAGATMLSPELRKSLSNFSNNAGRWAALPDPALAAQEYVQSGSDIMQKNFWGVVPARKVIEGLRRLPFLEPKDRWNPGAAAHYNAFAKGPLSAYNQLVKERMSDVPLKGLRSFLTKGYEERLQNQVAARASMGEQAGFEDINKSHPFSSPLFTLQKNLVDSHIGEVTAKDWGPRYRDQIIKPVEMLPWALGAAGAGAAGVGIGGMLEDDDDDEEDEEHRLKRKVATFALPATLRTIGHSILKPMVKNAPQLLPKIVRNPSTLKGIFGPLGGPLLQDLKHDVVRGGDLALNTLRGSGIMKSHVLPGFGKGFAGGVVGDSALQSASNREHYNPMEAISAGILGGVGLGGARGVKGLTPRYGYVKSLHDAGIKQEGGVLVSRLLQNAVHGGRLPRAQALAGLIPALKAMRPTAANGWEAGMLSNTGHRGYVGQVAMDALKGVGAKELGTGPLINPGVALAMSNPGIAKRLGAAGIERLHGFAESGTLSRVAPDELAKTLKLREKYFKRPGAWLESGNYDSRMRELEALLKSDKISPARRERILNILRTDDMNTAVGSNTRTVFKGRNPFTFDIDPRKGKGIPFKIAQ